MLFAQATTLQVINPLTAAAAAASFFSPLQACTSYPAVP
jgi:hypothetical protein